MRDEQRCKKAALKLRHKHGVLALGLWLLEFIYEGLWRSCSLDAVNVLTDDWLSVIAFHVYASAEPLMVPGRDVVLCGARSARCHRGPEPAM